MLKRIICLFWLFSIPVFSYCQDVSISMLKQSPEKEAIEFRKYFTKGDNILIVSMAKRVFHFQLLSASGEILKTTETSQALPKNAVLESCSKINDQYYIFYSLFDGINDQIFSWEIDFDLCAFKGEAKRIVQSNEKWGGTEQNNSDPIHPHMQAMNRFNMYNFFHSEGDEILAIQTRLKPEIRNDANNIDIIELTVFGPGLELKWKNKIKMPYTEKRMDNLYYSVNSKGDVYILAKVFDDDSTDEMRKKDGEMEPNCHLEILKITSQSEKIIPIKIGLENHFIYTLSLSETKTGEMECVGFYNSGKNSTDAKGIYTSKINDANMIYDVKHHDLPIEKLKPFASRGENRAKNYYNVDHKAEFENLALQEVIQQPNGSMLIVGEQFYARKASSGSMNNGTGYLYNDLLISKIDHDGKMMWMKIIPKRQVGIGTKGSMGYEYYEGKSSHYIIFHDNEENLKHDENENPEQYIDTKGGPFVMYKFDDVTGDAKRTNIFETTNMKGFESYHFEPNTLFKISPHTFLFGHYKKGASSLVRVDLH